MDPYDYPGKGLSLVQLVFALNEELRHSVCSQISTMSEVSQLDRDISTAHCVIREWKNSFPRVTSHILLYIPSPIPTHSSSQGDLFRASVVCHPHPGKGLSPTQLVFALIEELVRTRPSSLFVGEVFRTPWLSRFTLSEVSQLDCDISTAHRAVREWKNSFAHINRIPLDILFLIPTYFSSQRDIFRASSVCRHWRRSLLQHGALWTQLFLGCREDCVRTLLERAKGSALEIVIKPSVSPSTVALLSPCVHRIEHLKLQGNSWTDILSLSIFTSGPLPLLRTLEIRKVENDLPNHHGILPLFGGSTNLEEFTFDSEWVRLLDNFAFPKLKTFKLLTYTSGGFDPSPLFGSLKASRMLQTVELKIRGSVVLGTKPQEAVVVLPNVETLSLSLVGDEDFWHSYELSTRMSCPRAKCTSFMWEVSQYDIIFDPELFPNSMFWKTIAPHHTTSQVEGVTLEIERKDNPTYIYSLTFQSSNATVIRSGVHIFCSDREEKRTGLSHEEVMFKLFSQACQAIQGHTLLSHVKRLHIRDRSRTRCATLLQRMARVVVELLGSLGPLDELTIHSCTLEIFLIPYMRPEDCFQLGQVFPPVKGLAISGVFISSEEQCMDGLVKLAKDQHRQGKPFERLTVRALRVPMTVTERLRKWVGVVDVVLGGREQWR